MIDENIQSRYLNDNKSVAAPLRRQKTSAPLPGVFEDYLSYIRKYHQTPERTISANQRVLGAFANYLERHCIKLQTLGIEQIDVFLADYLKGYSIATCRIYRGYLRGFLSYLFSKRRLLSKDLAPLVTGPPLFARSKPPTFLRKDEVHKLFAGLAFSTASELRTAAMVHLAYMLGLRPCEISSLKLDDINFGKAELCLRYRKNDRPDRLPLPEPGIKTIAAYLIGGRPKSKHRTLFLNPAPTPSTAQCQCHRTSYPQVHAVCRYRRYCLLAATHLCTKPFEAVHPYTKSKKCWAMTASNPRESICTFISN